MLAIAEEGTDLVMTGVYGLNWFPTGPEVLARILGWMGFPEAQVFYWRTQTRNQQAGLGRLRMLASRKEGLLDRFESVTEPEELGQRAGDRGGAG
jgi:tRNA (mo5U34)-methyltransferase